MSDQYRRTEAQRKRIEPFPGTRGIPRLGRRVVSGIICGLRWRDAHAAYGPRNDASRAAPRRTRRHPLHSAASKASVARNVLQALYRHRHQVENSFAKLKHWRRLSLRYERCAYTFFSAIPIAAPLS
jgi:transposase